MPVKRRLSKRREGVSEEALAWLRGEDGAVFQYFASPDEQAEVWRANSDWVVSDWAAHSPGSRPELWWRFTAPEPRRQIGGSGEPAWSCLAHIEAYNVGLPSAWVDAQPEDPPTFESEAAYLRRLGLLLHGEARRLRPEDYEPVSLDGKPA